ncbi:hypothetical protein P170DRAFT_469626 [Aspergillus steynii IBT 23096]|uniref:Lipocalin-like domain-containing protein n=1 Tax=Aspergillus steynii IBT 23096 TaxID=1392250 RepID=A0A2I2GMQ1_9EURO|nr:uncharacterized protein P170DRAFT_469626 [Aspergillus steynii IBT 23096]PLB54162.1 hypothetical protein P170DRAFT_469626 [Aspergillus steynii IBT 23096]
MSRTPTDPAAPSHPFNRRIVGVWSLVDFRTEALSSLPTRYPLGSNPQGLLMYHPNGFMSGHLMKSEESLHSSPTGILNLGCAGSDVIGASHWSMSYAGAYQVSDAQDSSPEDAAVISHSIHVTSNPQMMGTVQQRVACFNDRDLVLSTTELVDVEGIIIRPVLTWRRVQGCTE